MKYTMTFLVNNEKITDALFNLYVRWLDEYMYEDIKDYGIAFANAVGSALKGSEVVLVKCNRKPFGFVLSIDGEKVNLFIKEKGDNVIICGKQVA